MISIVFFQQNSMGYFLARPVDQNNSDECRADKLYKFLQLH